MLQKSVSRCFVCQKLWVHVAWIKTCFVVGAFLCVCVCVCVCPKQIGRQAINTFGDTSSSLFTTFFCPAFETFFFWDRTAKPAGRSLRHRLFCFRHTTQIQKKGNQLQCALFLLSETARTGVNQHMCVAVVQPVGQNGTTVAPFCFLIDSTRKKMCVSFLARSRLGHLGDIGRQHSTMRLCKDQGDLILFLFFPL
nr:hypothetical protein [Pandoravirus aubagnensis]